MQSKIDNTAKASKEWREKWAFFWRKYYSLSDRVYNDRREKKKITLSPRQRYWNAFKETMPERFTNNKSKERIIEFIDIPLEEKLKAKLESERSQRAKMAHH